MFFGISPEILFEVQPATSSKIFSNIFFNSLFIIFPKIRCCNRGVVGNI